MRRALTLLSLAGALLFAASLDAAKPAKATKAAPKTARQSVGMGCVSPPAGWQVSVVPHEDWVSGQVRETASGRFVSF